MLDNCILDFVEDTLNKNCKKKLFSYQRFIIFITNIEIRLPVNGYGTSKITRFNARYSRFLWKEWKFTKIIIFLQARVKFEIKVKLLTFRSTKYVCVLRCRTQTLPLTIKNILSPSSLSIRISSPTPKFWAFITNTRELKNSISLNSLMKVRFLSWLPLVYITIYSFRSWLRRSINSLVSIFYLSFTSHWYSRKPMIFYLNSVWRLWNAIHYLTNSIFSLKVSYKRLYSYTVLPISLSANAYTPAMNIIEIMLNSRSWVFIPEKSP